METNFRPLFTFEKDLHEAKASDLNLSFNVSSFIHVTIQDYQLSTWILNKNKIYKTSDC